MKKKTKRILLALATVVVMIPVIAWGSYKVWARHAGSQAVVALMSEEQLIALGHEILESEPGSMPPHTISICFRLEEVDPELADACFEHILLTVGSAEQPKQSGEETP